jgi:hypothetical protein
LVGRGEWFLWNILSHKKKRDIRRDSVVNGARVNTGSAGADPRKSLKVRFPGLPGSKSMARIERSVEELERPIYI